MAFVARASLIVLLGTLLAGPLSPVAALPLRSSPALTPPSAVELFPSLEAESLSGQKVTLPGAAGRRPALLVIGFTRESRAAARSWAQRIAADFGADGRVALFQLALLEDVPRLLRGVVSSGIRRGVPAAEHGRFLLVFDRGRELRRAADFAVPPATGADSDAYLVLFDGSGAIRWRHHAPAPDAAYAELAVTLGRLAGSAPAGSR